MATLSSPGIGSGLDIKSIVEQLAAVERRPIALVSQQTSALQAKLSAFGLLQSYTGNIEDAAAKLAKASTWTQTSNLVTDGTVVSVKSTTAAVGNYTLEVSRLAGAHSLASKGFADSTAVVGTGTLHIDTGTWTASATEGPTFARLSGTSTLDIEVVDGENSLEKVKAKINAANAGVSASIVNDATGSRLVLRSTATGADHALRVTATPTAPLPAGDRGLKDLVYDPAADYAADPDNPPKPAMTEVSAAQNSRIRFNGLDLESSSNTYTHVTDGLDLTVSKETSAAVKVNVEIDRGAIKSALNDFANAYNALAKYVGEQTKYDPEKKLAATLQGDRSTLSLLGQIRSVLQASNAGASTTFASLSSTGLTVSRTGTLSVDDARFTEAMAHLPELAKAFTAADTANPGASGFAPRIVALTKAVVSDDGLVASRTQGLRSSIARNNKQVDAMEARVAAYQERLLKQYNALDVALNKLNGLNGYVAQQITAWNKSK